jgi:hypothetical protein
MHPGRHPGALPDMRLASAMACGLILWHCGAGHGVAQGTAFDGRKRARMACGLRGICGWTKLFFIGKREEKCDF